MRKLLILLVGGAALWAAAFLLFIATLPLARAPETARTDAIIVLTGSTGRVEQGLNALADGKAPVLFISGVGRKVTLHEIVSANASREVQEKIAAHKPQIVLDYVASTTQSNASEAAAFVAKHHIRTVRLITTYYHMPRSLIEFHAAMPGVTLVPDPVVPPNFRRLDGLRDEALRRRWIGEFHKYAAASVLRLMP